MAIKAKSDARLDFRLSCELKELIERAALLRGQSVTEFATATLAEKAQGVVQADSVRTLTRRDAEAFLAMLDNPPPPNEALKRAAKRFKARYG
jgi:uncharacterized protein (DUF1778 family)